MFSGGKVTENFYLADESSIFFDIEQEKSMLSAPNDEQRLFSFKLHLIINDKGDILNFVFTTESVDAIAAYCFFEKKPPLN